jgi:hypothetical protein
MPKVKISTTPPHDVDLEPSEASRVAVRGVLAADGCGWNPGYRSGVVEPLVTDVEMGVDALDAVEALAGAGLAPRRAARCTASISQVKPRRLSVPLERTSGRSPTRPDEVERYGGFDVSSCGRCHLVELDDRTLR